MRPRLLPLAALVLLPACAEVQTYGAVAIEQRRTMNDLQARATMAATCDISLAGVCGPWAHFMPINILYLGPKFNST